MSSVKPEPSIPSTAKLEQSKTLPASLSLSATKSMKKLKEKEYFVRRGDEYYSDAAKKSPFLMRNKKCDLGEVHLHRCQYWWPPVDKAAMSARARAWAMRYAYAPLAGPQRQSPLLQRHGGGTPEGDGGSRTGWAEAAGNDFFGLCHLPASQGPLIDRSEEAVRAQQLADRAPFSDVQDCASCGVLTGCQWREGVPLCQWCCLSWRGAVRGSTV